MAVTKEQYEEVKSYAVKWSTRGFYFLDAAPTSPIGLVAVASGEFIVNQFNMLEQV